MSEEHPNATAYRRAADAFRVGDIGAIESLVDASVVWQSRAGTAAPATSVAATHFSPG